MPQVPCKKERIRPVVTQSRKEPQVCHTDILGFIDNCMVKDHHLLVCYRFSQGVEPFSLCHQVSVSHFFPHDLKNRPEGLALCLRQPRLTTQSRYVPVLFPGFQLPGVYHLFPFSQQKIRTEFMVTNLCRCIVDYPTDLLPVCQVSITNLGLV